MGRGGGAGGCRAGVCADERHLPQLSREHRGAAQGYGDDGGQPAVHDALLRLLGHQEARPDHEPAPERVPCRAEAAPRATGREDRGRGGGARSGREAERGRVPVFSLRAHPPPPPHSSLCFLRSKVFRGLGRMLLPAQFWVPHGDPAWRGGVERAFMSTTADKWVALFYANGRGTVVEISVGRIQIGGDVSFLSMVRPTNPGMPSRPHRVPRASSAQPPAEARAAERAGRGGGGLRVAAVPCGEGDHLPALHLPGGRRRPPRGADPGGRGRLLPPQGPAPSRPHKLLPIRTMRACPCGMPIFRNLGLACGGAAARIPGALRRAGASTARASSARWTRTPPLLEERRAECGRTRSRVRGIGGQASVNPKVETVEELQGRRKTLHMGMFKLAREDLALSLQGAYGAFLVRPPPPPHFHPFVLGRLPPCCVLGWRDGQRDGVRSRCRTPCGCATPPRAGHIRPQRGSE